MGTVLALGEEVAGPATGPAARELRHSQGHRGPMDEGTQLEAKEHHVSTLARHVRP